MVVSSASAISAKVFPESIISADRTWRASAAALLAAVGLGLWAVADTIKVRRSQSLPLGANRKDRSQNLN
jgi:hypothetical protein